MARELRETPYGLFAADFAVDRLANLCDPEAGIQTGPFGSQLHQEDYVPVGTPIITVEHLGENRVLHGGVPQVSDADRDRLSRYLLRRGDIVFSRVGSVDRRALVRKLEDGWLFSGRCLRVRPHPAKIDSQYLSYFFGLPTFKEHIRAIAVGATMPSLNTSLLSDVVVPHPSDINEQRAIAHILGTLDDKIELNRLMSETLEAMARALFKSWFVDFDPVRAKAEGRDPGLPKPLADLFPARLVDSELGEIPEGWSVSPLGEICSRVAMGPFGSDIKTDNFVESGVPIVRGANLRDGFVDDQFVFLTEGKADDLKNANAFPGDIVITHRGTLGQVGLIPFSSRFPRYVVSQSQMLLTIDQRRSLARYVYMFLRSTAGQHALLANTSQTGVPAIARPTTSVKAIRLVSPGKPILEGFGKLVEPLYRRLDQATRDSRTLAALRDALLPMLISGEVRAPSAVLGDMDCVL